MLINVFRATGFLVFLFLAACADSHYGKHVVFTAWVDTPSTAYRIVPGDDLSVILPFNPELNYEAPVAPDGGWTMPLAGTVRAGGLTVEQVNQNIDKALLVNGIAAHAYASASVRSFAGRVFVGGQVKTPGPVAMQSEMDVLQAVSAAGGLLNTARTRAIVLIRRAPDGRPMRRVIDLDALTKNADPQQVVLLQPFDTIFVPQSSIVEVDQWVERYITKIVPFNQSINYNIGSGAFFK
nr:polysaccharide biosynthesis/export family protein [Gluconacetobacter asukensis]